MAPLGSYKLVAVSGSAQRVLDRVVLSEKVEQNLESHTHTLNDITDSGALAAKSIVDTTDIADDAVITAKIAALNITTALLADLAVDAGKIAAAAVTDSKLATDAVTTLKILDGAVIAAKLATDAVTSVKIQDSAVVTDKIADANVTADKILDGAITSAKLATDAVFTLAIQDSAVIEAKVADDAITSAKIAANALKAIAALTPADGNLIKYTGASTASLVTITAFAETLLDDADAAAARTTLGVIGAPSGLTQDVIPKADASGDLIDSQFADNGSQVTLWGRSLRFIGTGQPYLVEALNNAGTDYVHLIERGTSNDDVEIGVGGASNIVVGAPIKHSSKWVEFADHYRSITFDPLTINTPGGSNPPDAVALNGTSIQASAFDASTEEEVSDFIAIDGNFKEGSSLTPFVRWMPTSTDTGAVRWALEYVIISAGGTVSSSTTITFNHTAGGTAWQRQDINLSDITGTLNIGDEIHFRFYRDADDVGDTYADDAVCLSFGFHVTVNSIGSNATTSKI
jgi:hypothetical protein